MFDAVPGPQTFIRFGLQRKKEFLRDIRAAYQGLVLPANILLYQYKSTPSVVASCDKPFFVDPMSYLFGQPYDRFRHRLKSGEPAFKPSFARLLAGHGLPVDSVLRMDYRTLLRYLDKRENLASFIDNCVTFQLTTVERTLNTATDYLTPQQLNRLQSGGFRPLFATLPYFMYDTDNILDALNGRIYELASEKHLDVPIYPTILIRNEALTEARVADIVATVAPYEFGGHCIWVDDFNEHKASTAQIRAFVQLVRTLGRRGPVVILYGGYFSMILYHVGVACVCHGLAYGEARALEASTTSSSGPAPVRYYVRDLHRFFTLENAALILAERQDLVCDCPACRRVMHGDSSRVVEFKYEEALAEVHFLYNRDLERREIAEGLNRCLESLEMAVELNDDIEKITRPYKTYGGTEERPVASATHLTRWLTELRAL